MLLRVLSSSYPGIFYLWWALGESITALGMSLPGPALPNPLFPLSPTVPAPSPALWDEDSQRTLGWEIQQQQTWELGPFWAGSRSISTQLCSAEGLGWGVPGGWLSPVMEHWRLLASAAPFVCLSHAVFPGCHHQSARQPLWKSGSGGWWGHPGDGKGNRRKFTGFPPSPSLLAIA